MYIKVINTVLDGILKNYFLGPAQRDQRYLRRRHWTETIIANNILVLGRTCAEKK